MNEVTEIEDRIELPETAVAIRAEAGAVSSAILELAKDPNFNPDNLRALVDMQNSMEDRQTQREIRQAEREFNQAFVQLQGKLPRIKRDGRLEYPKDKGKPDGEKYLVTKFSKWETIDAAIRPILTGEGFGLSFRIAPRTGDGGGLSISAVLRHIGGHKEVGDPFPVPLDTSGGKNNLQGYGSSLSYGKRYAAFAALNIVTEGEDDDGKAAGVKYLNDAQVEALTVRLKEAGRQADTFLPRLCTDVRSATEVEVKDFDRVMNTLNEIINAKRVKL